MGRRTARQLSQDPQLHPLHQNRYRLIGHRSTRPSQLSHRYRTDTRTASIPSTETARGSAEVELHYLTQSVKLFLRQLLVRLLHEVSTESFKDLSYPIIFSYLQM